MTNESDTTPIRSLYAQRFAVDLETNRREQEATSTRIAELDARLQQLRADESWLCGMQGALPPASDGATAAAATGAGDGQVPAQPVRTPAIVSAALSATATGTPGAESVPRPRRARKTAGTTAVAKKAARPGKAVTTKTATTKATPAATKPGPTPAAKKTAAAAKKADPAKTGSTQKPTPAPTATADPPLRELVLAVLVGAAEPRMVSEVTTALAEAHPGRPASAQVVRNTLEALAKKGAVDKETKQGSVMYTAPRPAAGEHADDRATAGATGPRG